MPADIVRSGMCELFFLFFYYHFFIIVVKPRRSLLWGTLKSPGRLPRPSAGDSQMSQVVGPLIATLLLACWVFIDNCMSVCLLVSVCLSVFPFISLCLCISRFHHLSFCLSHCLCLSVCIFMFVFMRVMRVYSCHHCSWEAARHLGDTWEYKNCQHLSFLNLKLID